MRVLDLCASAFSTLRELPAVAWLWWASGALPFALAFAWFVVEMNASAAAAETLSLKALLVSVLYLWMGCAQTYFASYVRSSIAAEAIVPRSLWRVLRSTALIHTSALIVLPIGLASIIGAPSTFAFYQASAAYPDPDATARNVFRYSLSEGFRAQRVAAALLLIIALLAAVIFINVFVLVFGGPFILRIFTGQENDFTRNPLGMLNLATFSATFATTWLCLDPFVKTAYTLRCFEADSAHSGADLKASLRRAAQAAPVVLVCLSTLVAQPAPQAVDRAIREVSQRPEYVWRSPRVPTIQGDNAFLRFTQDALDSITRTLRSGWRYLIQTVDDVLRWLFRRDQPDTAPDGGALIPGGAAHIVTIVLIAAFGGLLVFLLLKLRRRLPTAVESVPAPAPAIDLASEDISPALLDGEQWLAMADTFAQEGNFRMAARAVFLALLASLGRREVIAIHRAKSNLDYMRELVRRTRGHDRLHDAFRHTVALFERTWYGGHELTPQLFEQYRSGAMNARSLADQS